MQNFRYLHVRDNSRFSETLLLMGSVLLLGLGHGATTDFATFSGTNLSRLIQLRPELREISQKIQQHGLEELVTQPNLTVFLPDNVAMARFEQNQLGYDYNNNATIRELLLYHSVNGVIYKSQIQNEMRMRTRTEKPTLLYVNTFSSATEQVFTVNGARLVQSDIEADNGVIHIIDRVMAPFGSDKTVVQYDHQPDLPYLAFTSVTAIAEINSGLFQRASKVDNFFTVFSPNDSYTYPIPEAAQARFYSDWILINDTIKAHIIPDKVLCLPALGDIPDMTSLNGDLKFTRRDGKVFVENNRVRAEVIIPNIPLRNGVLHVINNLLYFIYDNVYQKVARLHEVSIFNDVASRVQVFTNYLQSPETSKVTVLIPVDMAFAKLPTTLQNQIQDNPALLAQMLNSHIIVGQELDLDALSQSDNVPTLGNRTFKLVHMNNDFYIQHGGQRSKVVEANIGCTNGIIHLINDVLIDNPLSIWDNIENQEELRLVGNILGNHDDIRTTLSSDDGTRMTVFLPSSAFLEQLPSYSQRTLQEGGSHIHKILKGHIVEGAMVSSSDLKDGVERELKTKDNTYLYVTKKGHEIFVNGSHVIGKVTVADIWCSNGIIHVLDNILHIPTRNALDELRQLDNTGIASNLFSTQENVRHQLENSTSRLTLFVPSDNGLSKIPHSRIGTLRVNVDLLDKFLKAHILNGYLVYSREIPEVGKSFPAEEGEMYVKKSRDGLFVKNNGVQARIVRSNIPVTNGVIHVIDGAVWLAYQTLEEVLVTHPEVTVFYGLMSRLPQALSLFQSGQPLTLFAPSSGYISNLPSKIQTLTEDGNFLTKIFLGHTIPGTIVNTSYIKQQRSSWQITTHNNVSFRFKKMSQGAFSVTVYRELNLVPSRSAIQCTDGIIYILEEFLNFSPFTALEVVQREPNMRSVFNTMILRIPSLREIVTSEHMEYTVLAPDDEVSRTQANDLAAFYQNTHHWDSVIWRHIVLDGIIPLENLVTGSVRSNFTGNDVTFSRDRDAIYVTWKSIKSRVLRSDILTTNGIIHVIDKLLYQHIPPNMPSKTTTTNTMGRGKATTAKPRTGKSTNTSSGSTDRTILVFTMSLLSLSWIVVALLCL